MTVASGRFYRSETEWYHGVFYFANFATMVNVTATYVLWTTRGDSVVLLVGSPANIIGQNTPAQGLTLSSSGDALNTLGSMSFLEEIREDEENHFSSSSHAQAGLRFDRTPPSRIDWIYTLRTESRSVPLAMFCFRYLAQLPPTRIDTVFKIFSTFGSSKGDCLADLRGEVLLVVFVRLAPTGCPQSIASGRTGVHSVGRPVRPKYSAPGTRPAFLRLRRADHFHKFTPSKGPTIGSLPGPQEYKKHPRKIP